MRCIIGLIAVTVALLTGCTTPYKPAVFTNESVDFPGLIGLVSEAKGRPVDVLLVHGMCTHDETWANKTIDRLTQSINANLSDSRPSLQPKSKPIKDIGLVQRIVPVAGGELRFTALVWSPLTTPLKRQLDFDKTDSDCKIPNTCKPRRATLNGKLKDGLINDCIADALIYQGKSKKEMTLRMREAILQAIENPGREQASSGSIVDLSETQNVPLVLISESLGSKLVFDALSDTADGDAKSVVTKAVQNAIDRLTLVYMGANQLPLLGLADQNINSTDREATSTSASAPPNDSLERLLQKKRLSKTKDSTHTKITIVAFTDPNDLLSYNLNFSRYSGNGVSIVDVLVSNKSTYFGLLEDPNAAHNRYLKNRDVTTLIACGKPKNCGAK